MLFIIVGVETMRLWCKEIKERLNQLGQKIIEEIEVTKAKLFVIKRMMVQRWTVAVSMPVGEFLETICSLLLYKGVYNHFW